MSATTPTEGQPAAFFDLDLTLLSVNSAKVWLRHMWKQGELKPLDLVRSVSWMVQYRFALLDLTEVIKRTLKDLEGYVEADLEAQVAAWYAVEIKHLYYKEALALVEEHRQKGHRLFLATGSSPYMSRIAIAQVGLEDYVCTQLEVTDDGRFTGNVIEPVCYGEGKKHWASALAAREGVDLAKSWFYTDSYTDLPFLEAVGNPVATNPDPRLRRHAQRTGMPIRDFKI
jgi:HAD superfamily hydrolase (TIGR01490 family)